MSGKLDPDQYRELLRRGRPKLEWPTMEACPVAVDEEVPIRVLRTRDKDTGEVIESPQLVIRITRLRRNKKGKVVAEYSVRDDRPRYLAFGDGETSDRARALDNEVEIELDNSILDRLHAEKGASDAWLREQQRQREEKLALEFKLVRMRRKGRRASVVAIEQRIKRIEGRTDEAA